MLTAAMVLAVLAAALHVLIFYMESIAWEGPLARKTFGGTPEEARPHAFYAFNQGFYNLFLAIVTGLGIIIHTAGQHVVGETLVFTGAGSMVAASLVLLLSSPDKASAALKQGVIPALGVIALLIGLITS